MKKKDFLLKEREVCNFIAFVAQGCIRHYHMYDGIEKTCYVSFEQDWLSDTQSFLQETPSLKYYQALEPSTIYLIERKALYALYQQCPKFESLARIMYERAAALATEVAASLAFMKPEERYKSLLQQQPEIFQRVSQKHIAQLRKEQPTWFKEDLSKLFDLLAAGQLQPVIAQRMPLIEVQKAHELLEQGGIKGKIVLVINGGKV